MKSHLAGHFSAQASGKTGDRISAYGRGRICAAPGCDTLLSTYNPGLCCSLHDGFCAPLTRRSFPQARVDVDLRTVTQLKAG